MFVMFFDDSGFVFVSADKTVRFWEWILEKGENGLCIFSFNYMCML